MLQSGLPAVAPRVMASIGVADVGVSPRRSAMAIVCSINNFIVVVRRGGVGSFSKKCKSKEIATVYHWTQISDEMPGNKRLFFDNLNKRLDLLSVDRKLTQIFDVQGLLHVCMRLCTWWV